MMTSERLPIAWTCAMTRYGRRSAAGQARRRATKKGAWWPRMRSTSMALRPTRATASVIGERTRARSSANSEVLGQRPRRIVETDRTVRLAADELTNLRILGCRQLRRLSVRDHLALRRHQVSI